MKKETKEQTNIRKEIRSKIITYTTAAFGLVTGLAWNDAIRSTIEYVFPLEKNTLIVKFIYALLITVVLVLVSVYLARLLKEDKK